jgi:hypothetical protein
LKASLEPFREAAEVKVRGAVKRPEQIEFFLGLYGLWEGRMPRKTPVQTSTSFEGIG